MRQTDPATALDYSFFYFLFLYISDNNNNVFCLLTWRRKGLGTQEPFLFVNFPYFLSLLQEHNDF